jgi:glycosyltransferase involved in cell wall biosynthesis
VIAPALHVAMVTPSATGGHARYTWELLRALRAEAPPSELALTLVTSADLDNEFRTSAWHIADVLPPLRQPSTFPTRLHWAVGRALHYARREETVLRWVRARARLDVLHYQEPPFGAALHLRRVRAAGAIPLETVHNLRPHDPPVPSVQPLVDLGARLGWMQSATLFVHSAGLKDALARAIGPRSPPIIVVPHGVWTGHAAPASPPDRDGHLLLFGVMRRNKGLHTMLDALRQLPGRRLVLAGAFPDAAFSREIRDRVAAERLVVEILDRVIPESEIPALYGGAALAVLPYTEFHAQSGVLHLALAYGVPAVVTDVGALGEQVRREGIGLVAAPADPASLARTVLAALEPRTWAATRERCAALGRTLTWSTAARLTLEAYVQAGAGRREVHAHAW